MFAVLGAGVLGILAVGTVYVGSRLSLQRKELDEDGEEEQYMELTCSQILLFPLSASAMLIIMFFFHELMQYALLLLVTAAVSLALYDTVLQGILLQFYPGHKETTLANRSICTVFTAVVVIDWFLRGSSVTHDILGCAMCVQFISVVRFPSLRLAMLCLCMLFVYDFFWVFYSQKYEIFEGKNVMVEVATRPASNPLFVIATYFDWEWLKNIGREHVELPLKLIFPVVHSIKNEATGIIEHKTFYTMLGLGDITIPGLLVAYATKFDHQAVEVIDSDIISENTITTLSGKRRDVEIGGDSPQIEKQIPRYSQPLRLAQWTLGGYSVGLLLAFFFSAYTAHPQPALIYIVPSILSALTYRAHKMNCWYEVWRGNHQEHSE